MSRVGLGVRLASTDRGGELGDCYSDKEFYLDPPEAFVDFVIEAMSPDLADDGVQV